MARISHWGFLALGIGLGVLLAAVGFSLYDVPEDASRTTAPQDLKALAALEAKINELESKTAMLEERDKELLCVVDGVQYIPPSDFAIEGKIDSRAPFLAAKWGFNCDEYWYTTLRHMMPRRYQKWRRPRTAE